MNINIVINQMWKYLDILKEMKSLTLRSRLVSLNPEEELETKGDGCCDCIKLINKSVWEFGTFDFDFGERNLLLSVVAYTVICHF